MVICRQTCIYALFKDNDLGCFRSARHGYISFVVFLNCTLWMSIWYQCYPPPRCSFKRHLSLFGPYRQKKYLWICAHSEDSDQPARSRSLIRIITERILDSQGRKVSSYAQRRLWSDCVGAQADLSLHWAHMSEGPLSHFAARFVTCQQKCTVVRVNLSDQISLRINIFWAGLSLIA